MNAKQSQAPLWQALCATAQANQAAFHTPGHKRGRGLSATVLAQLGVAVGQMDLPELPELDNLFAPDSVIQAAQVLAAEVFGAEQTWFLTNGSTGGVIAAILATCGPGDQILMPRNVHTSVISGLVLSGAMPVFIQPELDPYLNLAYCLTPEAIESALQQFPKVKAVLVVYPTYEGICGDISVIATVTHHYGIPLLVDEAHGPHFAFHPQLPISALAAGADLAVQSTHKLLGALTQAAMLHVQGRLIDRQRISQALQLVQSTSPNYLLLASLDAARYQLALDGTALMQEVLTLSARARSHLLALPAYQPWEPIGACSGFVALDQTRLTIPTSPFGAQGYDLDQTLTQKHGVTAELVTPSYLTFLITLGNTVEDIDQLNKALRACYQPIPLPRKPFPLPARVLSLPVLSPREAYWHKTETVPLTEAADRISAESICPYPPGIPILLPGERIKVQNLNDLLQIKQAGGVITGCSHPSLKTLKVVRE